MESTNNFEERYLTDDERLLVTWLLNNGKSGSEKFIDQIPYLKVVSKCECGCASIDFSYKGIQPDIKERGMLSLSDYEWTDDKGQYFGVFVFSIGEQLAGLEVWSIDGKGTPIELPKIVNLRKLNVTR